jgi:hypothetical protein
LVLDMQQQVLGLDARVDTITITARRNGPNLELWVEAPNSPTYSGRYYSAPIANISSLTIRGTDDNETIRVVGNLGITRINVAGRGGDDTLEGVQSP